MGSRAIHMYIRFWWVIFDYVHVICQTFFILFVLYFYWETHYSLNTNYNCFFLYPAGPLPSLEEQPLAYLSSL